MNDSNTTPTPWTIDSTDIGEFEICGAPNGIFSDIVTYIRGISAENAEANARLIVQAVNSHQPMIDALEKTLHEVVAVIRCVTDPETLREMQAVADEARQALTLAKGEAQ